MTANSQGTEIFRAGIHPSSDGRIFFFSQQDLEEIAESYNPTRFRAPLIVSHDVKNHRDDAVVDTELAYGVVSRVWREGDSLKAIFNPIAPEVSQWVSQGRILDRSASFYPPDSGNNPTPGKWSLRHVALLGKTPPAVKGMSPLELGSPSFDDGSGETVDFSGDMDGVRPLEIVSQLFEGLRDVLIEDKGLSVAEAILPRDLVNAIKECWKDEDSESDDDWDGSSDEGEENSPSVWGMEGMTINPLYRFGNFNERKPKGKSMSTSTEAQLRAQIEELQQQVRLEKGRRRSEQVANFLERNRDRLPPALLEPVSLEYRESEGPNSFADFCIGLSDGQLEFMKQFVSRLPRQIEFGELTAESKRGSFAPSTQLGFDKKSAEVDTKIRAYQSQNPHLSYAEVALLPEFSALVSEVC